MTEILTESFCERCGTRYTFESAAPRQKRMGGLKVLGRGLKNFVMSDDSSLDEAFAAARSEADRELTAHQLDAFHQTFNFCMSCRQYTCATCWNEDEARCLSCAPAPEGLDVEAEIDPDRLLRFTGGAVATTPTATTAPAEVAGAAAPSEVPWPDMPWERRPSAPMHESEAAPQAAAEAAATGPFAAAGTPAAPEAAEPRDDDRIGLEAAGDDAEASGVGPTTMEPEGAGTPPSPDFRLPVAELDAQRADLAASTGFAPGEDLDEAIAAYEASVEQAEPDRPAEHVEPDAAAVAASETPVTAPSEIAAAPEPATQPEQAAPEAFEAAPEAPVVAAPVEPSPVAPEPPAPLPATEPWPVEPATTQPTPAPTPRVDEVSQPVWTSAPPLSPPAGPEAPPPVPAPQQPAPPAAANAAPQWPTGPRWPTAIPARGAPPVPEPTESLAALISRPSSEALWAASSREILQPVAAAQAPGVQPCINCGISLSATARFCRRCGTPQQS